MGEMDGKIELLEETLFEYKTEIDFLKQYTGIYHAKKTDTIDQALGQYLNNYPEREKLQIMFLRES